MMASKSPLLFGAVPASFPTLPAGQAHVWRCDLSVLPVSTYQSFLSEDERQRAARFHFPLHRERYIAGRGALRHLLAQYLGQKPADFSFALNEHGKPELVGRQLRFNVSHSQHIAMLAFCHTDDIGVDLEFRRDDYDDEKITRLANRFFCEAESKELATLSGTAKQAAFFRCWTRKEALLKATGEGIAGGLATYRLSLLPGQKAQLLAPPEEAGKWSLCDLQPGESIAGALAVRAERCEIVGYDFTNAKFIA
jgi:4'-phosphopantetheinyl transferase